MAEVILSADDKYTKLIRDRLNSKRDDILCFSSDGEMIDIFMFAIALGVNERKRTPSQRKEGFIRESAFTARSEEYNLLYSIAFQELLQERRGNELQYDNPRIVFEIAEEFANTGFAKLENMLSANETFSQEDFIYKMIEILDQQFQKIHFDWE